MSRLLGRVTWLLLFFFCSSSMAARIVSCEIEWAQLAQEISGYKAEVSSLLTERQDPHHFTVAPNSIALVRAADLLVCNDIEHEPHLKELIHKSGNVTLQPGEAGYLDVGQYIEARRLPGQAIVLSWQHAQGDPRNILIIAEALRERLTQIDPANSGYYSQRYGTFSTEWTAAMYSWEKRARPLKGVAVVVQRNACEYLCRWLGIREVATVEPTQGSSVNLRQMSKILESLNTDPATMIIAGPYHSSPAVSWLSKETKLPVITLPTTRDKTPGAQALYKFFDETIDRMLGAISQSKKYSPARGKL
jgi:zinc/manganese transport system substrate-binding protein